MHRYDGIHLSFISIQSTKNHEGQVEGVFDMLCVTLPTCDSGSEIQSHFGRMHPCTHRTQFIMDVCSRHSGAGTRPHSWGSRDSVNQKKVVMQGARENFDPFLHSEFATSGKQQRSAVSLHLCFVVPVSPCVTFTLCHSEAAARESWHVNKSLELHFCTEMFDLPAALAHSGLTSLISNTAFYLLSSALKPTP